MDFYIASSSENVISYLLISGGASIISGLDKILEEHVGVPVQINNPFSVVGFDPLLFTEDYIKTISPIAVVPIGLAMRGFE